jgi:AGZA family xanthine/uracil permease-like MFS transporter
VIGIVPPYATAPALILVGFLMAREVRHINFADLEEGFPAFVIMVMIALSYSISTGLALGFLAFVLFKVILGKGGEVKPVMWLIAVLSFFYFIL